MLSRNLAAKPGILCWSITPPSQIMILNSRIIQVSEGPELNEHLENTNELRLLDSQISHHSFPKMAEHPSRTVGS